MKFPIYYKAGAHVIVIANKIHDKTRAVGFRVDKNGNHDNYIENILSYMETSVDFKHELNFLYSKKEINTLYDHLTKALKIPSNVITWNVSSINATFDKPTDYLIISESYSKLINL